jgi:hypothetical protein
LEVAYPKAKPSKPTADSKNNAMDGVRRKDQVAVDDRAESDMMTANDATKKLTRNKHKRYVPVKYSNDTSNY